MWNHSRKDLGLFCVLANEMIDRHCFSQVLNCSVALKAFKFCTVLLKVFLRRQKHNICETDIVESGDLRISHRLA